MTLTHLQARGAVHYQHQNPPDNQKSTSTVNAYISIKMGVVLNASFVLNAIIAKCCFRTPTADTLPLIF